MQLLRWNGGVRTYKHWAKGCMIVTIEKEKEITVITLPPNENVKISWCWWASSFILSFFTFGSSFRRVAREDLCSCSFFESHLCSIAGLQSLAHANDNQTRVISFLAYASCIYKNEMRQGGSSCSIGRRKKEKDAFKNLLIHWMAHFWTHSSNRLWFDT